MVLLNNIPRIVMHDNNSDIARVTASWDGLSQTTEYSSQIFCTIQNEIYQRISPKFTLYASCFCKSLNADDLGMWHVD